MEGIYIFAFTHRHLEVNQVGQLHIDQKDQQNRLVAFKNHFDLAELMFLSTCNRVELIIRKSSDYNVVQLENYLRFLYPSLKEEEIECFCVNSEKYSGFDCITHLMKVSASIDSMVVGEREIITQVRKAYEFCHKIKLTGDAIRLMVRYTIETAKKIYTETSIAKNPVSVVSLAYQTLKEKNIPLDAKIIFVGSGITNTNMGRFLDKHGFTNFLVFNRTIENAEFLASHLNTKPQSISELQNLKEHFDIIITCTGSDNHIISEELYSSILQGDKSQKICIDLALPSDIHPEVIEKHNIDYISIDSLQKTSNANLKKRANEILKVEQLIHTAAIEFKTVVHERQVEIAMRKVPEKVKEIKEIAIQHVFAEKMDALDEESKETVNEILAYFEKKYISVPMKMAKEILLKK